MGVQQARARNKLCRQMTRKEEEEKEQLWEKSTKESPGVKFWRQGLHQPTHVCASTFQISGLVLVISSSSLYEQEHFQKMDFL